MAAHGARRLLPMARERRRGRRHRAAGRGAGLRFPSRRCAPARRSRRRARGCATTVPRLDDDRYLHPDIAAATALVRSGAIVDAVGDDAVAGVVESKAMSAPAWLTVERGDAPLIVSIPHAGLDLDGVEAALRQRLAGAARRRLAHPAALRFRRARSARQSSARRCRARSSTSTATRAAPRSIPARRRPSSVRRRPSTASRSIATGEAPTPREIAERRRLVFRALSRRARSGDRAAQRRSIGASRSTTAIRSVRAFRACSTASCRSSTSGPTAAPAADPRFARARRRRCCTASGEPFVVDGRFKGGWITRALRATGARRPRAADGARLPRLYGRAGAPRRDELADPARPIPRRCDARDAEARARGGAAMGFWLMFGATNAQCLMAVPGLDPGTAMTTGGFKRRRIIPVFARRAPP